MRLGIRFGGAGHDRATWLVLLFLLVGVLAPTACVLWFMNEAARAQADSARQEVTEAYRGQLRLMRDRLDSYWAARIAAMEEMPAGGTPADFLRIVTAGLADSVILLNRDGTAAYPSAVVVSRPDPALSRSDWMAAQELEATPGRLAAAAAAYAKIAQSETDPSLAARAAQAWVRCLIQNGEKEAAIQAIRTYFTAGPAATGTDLQGRVIAADEQMLALQLMQPGDSRYSSAVQRLAVLLNDYQRAPMPSAQRLFLVEEMRTLEPRLELPELPAYRAERMAIEFLQADGARPAGRGLQPSHVPDVWKLASPHGRLIALYRTGAVLASLGNLLEKRSQNVSFEMISPGGPSRAESIPAGSSLPGWQLSFALLDAKALDELARHRMAAYLWVGYLLIAAMGVTGLIIGQSFRRQFRLARLKTDLVASVSHELKTPLSSVQVLVDSLLEDARPDPQKTHEYLQLISGENLRLARLIENFLTFSRIERKRQEFEFTETKPENVIRSAVHVMRERVQPPACRLEVEISPNLPSLHADEAALVTVLVNLLDNACKYTPREKRIVLRAYLEGGQLVFAVSDNGIGIAQREQKRIFRRFYQVDRRLSRETGGCGLGLNIVEFIVRAHGGAVRVKSELGAGSRFSVSLPCAGAALGAGA